MQFLVIQMEQAAAVEAVAAVVEAVAVAEAVASVAAVVMTLGFRILDRRIGNSMTTMKLTKKSLLLVFIYLIVISGVLGILREIFLKEYEKQYHFWISVSMAAFGVATMMGVMVFIQRFFNKNR
jgi:RsiW-degrading membrane proteinase PrsW (M82 family)